MAQETKIPHGEKYGVHITFIPASEVSVQWEDGNPYAIVSTRMILRPKDLFKPDMGENEKENFVRQVTSVIVAELRGASEQ